MNNLKEISKELKIELFDYVHRHGGGHLGGSLSCVDILVDLYFNTMKINPEFPQYPNRDRFILSKGHAGLMLYLILKKRGYKIDPEKLLVHPEIDIDAGIEASTGSLGHGLPIGVGMALAAKMNDQNYRVFVLVGDGECQEGSIWESVMFACRMKLDNLFIIVDSNKYQALDRVDNILNMSPLENKFRAFGCSTISIDGHSFESIDGIFKVNDAPAVIIANTIKGNGISFMLNNPLWHYRGLTEDEYRQGLKELESC